MSVPPHIAPPIRGLPRAPDPRIAPLLLAALLLAGVPGPARAQEDGAGFASTILPEDHWAGSALRKLYVIGLVERHDPGAPITALAAARAFREAGLAAARRGPGLERLARSYEALFAQERPATTALLDRRRGPTLRYEGSARGVGEHRRGDLATIPTTDELPASGTDGAERLTLSGELSVLLAPHLAFEWGGRRERPEGGAVREAYGVARFGPVALWGGRRAPAYGPGLGGGVVLDGAADLPGGGVFLPEPVLLPGPLSRLGDVRLDLFIARAGENGTVGEPWLWGARASLAPHRRFGVAVTRGALFGGEQGEPVTLGNVLRLVVGKHGSGGSAFENQIAAVDAWYRPPLGGLPLLLYLEWGLEDSAGAWLDVPGRVAGVELAAVPGLPELALGLEYASFGGSCCGNPPWYRHMTLVDGWTEDRRPLGHPLGGEGTEWLLQARAHLAEARLRLEVTGLRRSRGEENLYAPQRAGTAVGGLGEIGFRPVPALELRVAAFLEDGSGWSERYVEAGVRVFLR